MKVVGIIMMWIPVMQQLVVTGNPRVVKEVLNALNIQIMMSVQVLFLVVGGNMAIIVQRDLVGTLSLVQIRQLVKMILMLITWIVYGILIGAIVMKNGVGTIVMKLRVITVFQENVIGVLRIIIVMKNPAGVLVTKLFVTLLVVLGVIGLIVVKHLVQVVMILIKLNVKILPIVLNVDGILIGEIVRRRVVGISTTMPHV
jgi:hypothetical protein